MITAITFTPAQDLASGKLEGNRRGVGTAGVWLLHALLPSTGVAQETVVEVSTWTALHPLTDWIGTGIFHTAVDYTPTGSGDTATQWIAVCTLLLVSLVVATVWSVLDRRRPAYVRLYEWFRLVLRMALASALLLYGMVNLLPSQMAFSLERLVEPFGYMSPMMTLWAQTAGSERYEMALGAAEITAGLLLIVPLTAGLGAVLSFIVALQVLLLNLTYDVPVKLFSFQLLAFATVLAAPEILRIVKASIGHALAPRTPEPLLTPRTATESCWQAS